MCLQVSFENKWLKWSQQNWKYHCSSFFLKPDAYITHNTNELLSDITDGNLSDNMQLPTEPQKALTAYFFHICRYTLQDLYTQFNV